MSEHTPVVNPLSEFRKHAAAVSTFFMAVCEAVGIDQSTKMKMTLGGQDETIYEASIEEAVISLAEAGKDLDGMELVPKGSANLFAAAPDLLGCLAHLTDRDWFKDGVSGDVVCTLDADKVRAAIAKATGDDDQDVIDPDAPIPFTLQEDGGAA